MLVNKHADSLGNLHLSTVNSLSPERNGTCSIQAPAFFLTGENINYLFKHVINEVFLLYLSTSTVVHGALYWYIQFKSHINIT